MQIICTSLQTENNNSTSSLDFFTGRMLFPMLNQQCQSNALQQKSTEMVAKPTHWDCYALWTQFTTVNQAKNMQLVFL